MAAVGRSEDLNLRETCVLAGCDIHLRVGPLKKHCCLFGGACLACVIHKIQKNQQNLYFGQAGAR